MRISIAFVLFFFGLSTSAYAENDCKTIKQAIKIAKKHAVDTTALKTLKAKVCTKTVAPKKTSRECKTLRTMTLLSQATDGSPEVHRLAKTVCDIGASGETFQYWSNGKSRVSNGFWYYPNGKSALSNGFWYYPNGKSAFSNGYWYYPNGQAAFSNGYWYWPNGKPSNSIDLLAAGCSGVSKKKCKKLKRLFKGGTKFERQLAVVIAGWSSTR